MQLKSSSKRKETRSTTAHLTLIGAEEGIQQAK
jgi:hypothetical protein